MKEAEVLEVFLHAPMTYTPDQWLEKAGRTCYKSEDKITEDSSKRFVRMLRDRGHHAMLEHCVASAIISADRGLTHELVRHRLASFAQESTRYCNYSKGKFNGEITVIKYPWVGTEEEIIEAERVHKYASRAAEKYYNTLLKLGQPPQLARAVLPISLKSEIVITANLREWMHIFTMRCDTPAHPIIRSCALRILNEMKDNMPSVYELLAEKYLHRNEDLMANYNNKELNRYWVSWYSAYLIDEGCTKPPFQIWISGTREREDEIEECTICSVIDAESEDQLWNVIQKHFPDCEKRFCKKVEKDYKPGNRFTGFRNETSLTF